MISSLVKFLCTFLQSQKIFTFTFFHILSTTMTSQWKNAKTDHTNRSPSKFLISKLIRVSLLFMFCTMLVLTCGTSILKELYGNPQPPIVEILAISVSGLNVSRASIAAKWDVILTIQNSNFISTFHFEQMEGMVLYKEEVMGVSELKQLVLGPKEHTMIRFRVWRKGWDGAQPAVKEWIMAKIKEDSVGEEMDFNVQMAVWAKIKCGWWWKKSVIMNPRCKDLSIDLVRWKGFGMLLTDGPIQCSVPMLDN